MQTANMMAHAKSTSIPVTENVKEANSNLDHFCSSSIFLLFVNCSVISNFMYLATLPMLEYKQQWTCTAPFVT